MTLKERNGGGNSKRKTFWSSWSVGCWPHGNLSSDRGARRLPWGAGRIFRWDFWYRRCADGGALGLLRIPGEGVYLLRRLC